MSLCVDPPLLPWLRHGKALTLPTDSPGLYLPESYQLHLRGCRLLAPISKVPKGIKEGLRTTQGWKSFKLRKSLHHRVPKPRTCYQVLSHTYIVQLVVEPTGVTDRIAIGISPPQGGSGGLTVRAGRARPPGCRLREGEGETGEEKERERKAPVLKNNQKKKKKKMQSAKLLRKKTSTLQD